MVTFLLASFQLSRKKEKGEPVSQIGEEPVRDCEVGVKKEAGKDDIVINHLKNNQPP
jgi:hypothetical protein